MFAKRFFYVCAGLFLLALSYHLGANSAGAQAGAGLTPASVAPAGGGVAFTAASGRTAHLGFFTGSTGLTTATVLNPVPGTSPIAALGTDGTSDLGHTTVFALLESGEVYMANTSAGIWDVVGNLVGGPTPVQRESFGAMKSRLRGERGAAQPTQGR